MSNNSSKKPKIGKWAEITDSMMEVKKPKNDNLDNFIDILADTVCYLIAHGAGPDLSINEKAMKLNQIRKSLEQYRNGKS